ncbi:MAG: DUF58 domain-containing protein [Flavobacteriales bacterium]|jgi:uncharacterized protein (DUF58 family)|tara:strand:+ start:3146 stop:4081 length:936 start_codon:yes stop_codon:yes gene_type:complete
MALNIDRRKFQQLSKLEFMAKQAVEGFITGMHKSPFHGFSVEFAEHKLYNTGESTRHIDWKLYARSEKLFVKRYEEETNLRCHLVIDHSSSMYFPAGVKADSDNLNKLKFSIYASAAMIELFRRQRDAVGLSLFSDTVSLKTKAKSSASHHQFLYNELEGLLNDMDKPSQKKTFTVEALHEIAESIPRRSLVVIFSDMLDNSERSDELFSALQHLKHNKHEVILFHTVDKSKEIDFDFANRPYTFVDMESGDEVKVNPRDVREEYVKGITEFAAELKLKCGQYGIDFVEADINAGFNQILLQYLVKRKKML